MSSKSLIGRRVRVIHWYDHAKLVAVPRRRDRPEGTITRVNEHPGGVLLTVRFEGSPEAFAFKLHDVEILP